MKKFLKILSLVVLLCALSLVFVACDEEPPAPAETSVVDAQGIAYRLNSDEDTYSVIGFSSHDEINIVIPERVKGKAVVSIQTGAFRNDDKIKSIIISSGVTSIGEGAFSGCVNLESLSFKNGAELETIGVSAFANCTKLATATLPDGLISIGENAFENCSALLAVEIPQSVETLSDNVFRDCSRLESVVFATGSTLTKIGEETFTGCMSLKSITLPDSLTDIGNSAFLGCSALVSVELPESLVNIEKYAFYGCAFLAEITIPDSVENIGVSAFNNCQKLKKVNFGEDSSLVEFKAHTFENCLELLNFEVPNGIENIAEKAFFNCQSLKSITFGEDSALKVLNNQVFVGCDSLLDVELPKNLTTIKASVFEGCKSLNTVTVADNSKLVDIGARAFYNCDNLSIVTFGELGVLREVGANAFYDCDRLITVDFGAYSTLKKIGAKAFYDCDALFTMTIPVDVNDIGANAFGNCYRLVEVNDLSKLDIKKGETTFGGVATYAKAVVSEVSYDTKIAIDEYGYATYNDGANISLVGYIGEEIDLVVPFEISDVNRYAFYKNSNVKTIFFEENSRLNKIDQNAFESCTALKSVEVPVEVLEIGKDAFKNCKVVTSIYYNARNCANLLEDTGAFNGVGASTSGVTVTVGRSVVNLPDYLFSSNGTLPRVKNLVFSEGGSLEKIGKNLLTNNKYVTSLNIPYTLRYMGESAFENTNLINLTFEDGCWMYNMPQKAFYNCTKLLYVDFGDNSYLSQISDNAFENCSNLRTVTLGETNGLMIIGNDSFKNCINLTSFRVPSAVHEIGEDAFYNCYRLSEVIDEAGSIDVTIGADDNGGIAKYALLVHDGVEGSFVNTDENGYVVLSDGDRRVLVNYVGNNSELVIPQEVTDINNYTFRDMTKITSLRFAQDSALTTFGDNVFLNCNKLATVEIPLNAVNLGESIFDGCVGLKTVYYNAIDFVDIVEDTVLFDGTGTQNGIDIVVGSTVEKIPAYLCRATEDKADFLISSVTFANSSNCVEIGDYAFAGMSSIPQLVIPDSVVTIGDYAFKDCTGIAKLNFSDTSALKKIGVKAFENCISITTIKLPSKVNNIAPDAFDGLSKVLTSIEVAEENTTYHSKDNCLVKTSNNTLMIGCRNSVIPDYIVTIADNAFKNCNDLKKVTIPETAKVIGDEAFYYCIGLEKVTIEGETLVTIGRDAFTYCSKVTEITLPNTLKNIGSHAFLYCSGLTKLNYTGTAEEWGDITFGEQWNYRTPLTNVVCSDGNVEL